MNSVLTNLTPPPDLLAETESRETGQVSDTGVPGGGVPPFLYQLASASVSEGILIGDARRADRPILYVNPALERLTGYPAAEALGKNFLFFQGRQADPAPLVELRHALVEGKPCRATLENHRKNGAAFWGELSVSPVRDEQGELTHFVAVLKDVTARHAADERLRYLASHDSLTRLANRAHFASELESFVRQPTTGPRGALLYFDIDNFKLVNDSLGHLAGDRVLVQFAGILREQLRGAEQAARYGGDEFMVLVRQATLAEARELAGKIRRAFQQCRFSTDDQWYDLSLSAGVAAFDGHQSAEELLCQADLACCAAKKNGRDRLEVYRPDHPEIVQFREAARWSHRLKEAIRREEFELWFQPVFALPDQRLDHYEVLVRLRDAGGAAILPGNFLPVAERFQMAHAIDRLVIKQSLPYLQRDPGLKLSLNLSGRSFDDPGFVEQIESAFAAAGVSPTRVEFEITETAVLSSLPQACAMVGRLKKSGFRFALDDFGCGFSSLTYLRELPVDSVKIDGSFIRHLKDEPINEILVRSMKETARVLGLQTVAEFVEDQPTLELLRYIGVDFAQGNFLGPARSF